MLKKVKKDIWSGRTDHLEDRTSFRYHQVIELEKMEALQSMVETCIIIGFESEEGVRRNKGQLGAAKAPDALRSELAKLPWRLAADKHLADIGTIECVGNDLEKAQQQLGEAVNSVLSKKMIPIILGGGHETAYGHYLGVRENIGKEAKLGIINIDAHFDLRPYDEQTSSGTMFRQILEQDENSSYFVLGIQRYGNTQELFNRADELNVQYILEENMHDGQMDQVKTEIEKFIQAHDWIMLTLCTDVLNAAFAPGVSAPSPFGLDPSIVRAIIKTVTSHEKVLSFDISEVNPILDENNRTVKLGAYLTNEAITSFLGGRKYDTST
ncbi:formimidoylglutamase [Psychrobacillus sp. NEAU-3TGS]|uniref:formimidoylglutamase n=1 Tax=Psychrobacillus sp. NEAU-3TGS TaxID=2995412 RepID=UPI0024990158|nr:formimidoylglutamase [Psychrobacillus sp. NEAU-3TGS]MDI2585611.1 formimidoylglutamase [Psychrobacillus sp. NEAU-3TGS]